MIFIVVTSNCVLAHSFSALSFKLGFLAFSAPAVPSVSRLLLCFSESALGLGAAVCDDAFEAGEVAEDVEADVMLGVGTAQVNGSAVMCYRFIGACSCHTSISRTR